MVSAVFLEVTLFACGLDLLGDLGATLVDELIEFGFATLVCLLGKPGDRIFDSHVRSLRVSTGGKVSQPEPDMTAG